MKRLVAFLTAVFMIMSMTVVSFAKPGKPGKPDKKEKNVYYFISRWGVQWDVNGDVQTRDAYHFSSSVGNTTLEETLESDFSIAIGNGVTEADILSYLNDPPSDDEVFEKLYDEFQKAYIYTSTGKLVSWENFTSENYGVEWYVLKHELDGWHVDGRITELETNEDVNIVLPEEKDEFIETVLPDVPDVEQPEEVVPPPEEAEPEISEDPEVIPEEKDEGAVPEIPEVVVPDIVEPEDKEPEVEDVDTSISLKGASYAYIFGYEPIITKKYDEDGNLYTTAEIYMGMDDAVTVEQVSSMLMRMLDQSGNTMDMRYPAVGPVAPHKGQWYERGLAYLYSVGAFADDENIAIAPIKRGHVAKLVSCALKLNLSCETPFKDIDSNPYKEYIEKVYKYGYMNGVSSDQFDPEGIMTRAEFCALFNNIIDRNSYGLTAKDEDGNIVEVTAETYYFIDMDPSHWAYEICLKASSAYDSKGYIDLTTRNENIRNILDKYDSQKEY